MKNLLHTKIRVARYTSIIVPMIAAILLSFGNDYIMMHSFRKDGVVNIQVLEDGLLISNGCEMLGLALAILVSNMIFRMIIRQELVTPLQKLRDGMNQIRQGNYSYQITYEDKDPMFEIYDDFNEMAIEMRRFEVAAVTAEESRKKLLLSVSHDLRSPLTSILAFVQGLMDGVARTEEKKQRYLENIKKKSLEIDRLVNRLFMFAKLDSNEMPLNLEPIGLAQHMEMKTVEANDYYHHQNFDVELKVVSDAKVMVDVDMFDRICNNLIDNACKYTDKDWGQMNITVKSGEEYAKIVFADNGPGVPEESLAHLWDLFYRTDSARKNPGKSNGIGLAIVKKATETMGGKVSAKNGQNGGLQITLRLPVIKEESREG